MSDAPALEAGSDPRREAMATRLVLPFALPVLSALAIALWVLNISRAFIAGGKTGALVIVIIVTIGIMAGAAFASAAPRLQSSTLLLVVAAALVLIVSAGFVSLGPSQEHGEAGGGGGYVPPKGPAVATVEIDALPQLKFQSKDFPTQAGVNEIKYIDKGGTHTLLFAETELAGFKLQVPPDDSGKVDLKPGTYTVFCDIPGHRAAGMEATITVK